MFSQNCINFKDIGMLALIYLIISNSQEKGVDGLGGGKALKSTGPVLRSTALISK